LATFVLFYLMTVFALSWGISDLGYTREQFLPIQMLGVIFFGLTIPLSAWFADRFGRQTVLLWATALIGIFGLLFEPLFGSGNVVSVVVFMILGLALMGLTYGPLGTALSEPFPVGVRYTGASLAFNLAGIFGASLAPYVATTLATKFGIQAVGFYLTAASIITFLALWGISRHAGRSAPAALISQEQPG
jgi:MFS family permease